MTGMMLLLLTKLELFCKSWSFEIAQLKTVTITHLHLFEASFETITENLIIQFPVFARMSGHSCNNVGLNFKFVDFKGIV